MMAGRGPSCRVLAVELDCSKTQHPQFETDRVAIVGTLDAALDISAGPAHFSDRWATTFDLVLAHTGHLDICRAIRFQIMLARTITNLNIYFLRSPFATARRQHGASRACQSNTLASVIKQCLDHAAHDISMRTSVASGHFSSTSTCMCKQFGVLLSVWRFRRG